MIDVSVVIPTFRRRALLLEAILSVLRQPQVSIEIIVADDSPEG
jgi:glycosyltransferase involved in cell wall biosynthesis